MTKILNNLWRAKEWKEGSQPRPGLTKDNMGESTKVHDSQGEHDGKEVSDGF
jgi:hypothetical protein